MPGIQKKSRPEATVRPQGVEESREPLRIFLELCKSCQGPRGKVKFIQNSIGGSLTVTSVSKRLFSCVSIRTPILKFLTSAVQNHLNAYGDGGLFFASLVSGLVKSGYESEINCRILSEIFETFLTLCMEYLNSGECHYRYAGNVADISFMSSFVGTIFSTKPLCRLNGESQKYLTVLILDCFLNSVSEKENSAPSENIFVTTGHAESVHQSSVLPGVLIVAPELSKYKLATLSFTKAANNNGKSGLKVALITASMSGDLEELSNIKFDISGEIDVEMAVIDQLSDVCSRLVQSNVGLVLCQKVIHPRLKRQLRASQVLVVDRIGLQPIRYISRLSGASPIGCLDIDIPANHFGWIDDVKHVLICDQSYIQLINGDNPVTTLLLTHLQEQPLNEIKELSHAALSSLDQLLREPAVLCGGGCWQAGLVYYLKYKMQEEGHAIAQSLEIPRRTVYDACHLFTSALFHSSVQREGQVLFNSSNGHLYTETKVLNKVSHPNGGEVYCCCGLARFSEDNCLTDLRSGETNHTYKHPSVKPELEHTPERRVLWDSLSVRRNALQMAVLSACAALRVGQVMDTG